MPENLGMAAVGSSIKLDATMSVREEVKKRERQNFRSLPSPRQQGQTSTGVDEAPALGLAVSKRVVSQGNKYNASFFDGPFCPYPSEATASKSCPERSNAKGLAGLDSFDLSDSSDLPPMVYTAVSMVQFGGIDQTQMTFTVRSSYTTADALNANACWCIDVYERHTPSRCCFLPLSSLHT